LAQAGQNSAAECKGKSQPDRVLMARDTEGKPRPSDRSCLYRWELGMTEKLPRG
jgi:hypothetical protein